MASVDLVEYTAQVENCRQLLKQSVNRLSNALSEEPSLIECVQLSNSFLSTIDTPPDVVKKNRIRFYDADGTLLKTEWLLPGEDATPPENVNADPEYLEFAGWASANEGVFTNLQSDMDYGAYYNFKHDQSTAFITVTEDTTLDFTISFKAVCDSKETENLVVTLDWGDGTVDTETLAPNTAPRTYTKSHTYSTYGDYTIILRPSLPIRDRTNNNNGTATWFYGVSTSSSYNIFKNNANANATRKLYLPISEYVMFFNSTKPHSDAYVIFRTSLGGYSSKAFILAPRLFDFYNTTLGISYFTQDAQYAECYKLPVILDNRAFKDTSVEHSVAMNVSGNCYYNDGLVMGKCYTTTCLSGQITPKRITCLGTNTYLGGGASYGWGRPMQRLQYAPNSIIYARVSSQYPVQLPGSKTLDLSKNTVKDSELYASTDCTTLILPELSGIQSSTITLGMYIQTLVVPKGLAVDVSLLSSSALTDESYVHLLNNVADLSNAASKKISVKTYYGPLRLQSVFVYKLADIYILADPENPQEGSISILEAFNNKNWTIETRG